MIFLQFLASFVLSILLFLIFKCFSFASQPQREFVKFAEEKAKSKPVPCGGIVFFGIYSLYFFASNRPWFEYFALLGFFAIGFLDDIGKVLKKSHISFLKGKWRLLIEILFAFIFANGFLSGNDYNFFFYGYEFIVPKVFGIFLIVFIIVGTANAVNLTDGQDALAGRIVIVNLFFIMAVVGLDLGIMAIVTSLMAFLLFNAKPATVYMGDSGSMFLGAFLPIYFLNSGIEWFLPITGMVFVIETLSVMIQVSYFKATKGKRIFKMSPFHHHLELCNISEEKISNMAFIVTLFLCIGIYFLYCV